MEKIEIVEFEDKIAKTGRHYTRFKTSSGWMSCFDIEVINPLKQKIHQMVDVDIYENDQGFKTIKTLFNVQNGKEPNSYEQAKDKFVERAVKIDFKPTENKSTTMYTSYAKDIYCSLNEHKKAEIDPKELMNLSIELVKQARDAFS